MTEISSKALNRIERSKLNTIVAIATSILMGVFSFIERTVFNWYFIEDYLGLYSFYNNVTGILATIELGIATSIGFALYEPLEHKRYDQIAAIMSFFKKTYLLIGSIIFIAGIAVIPFFPKLVKSSVPMNEVQLYFVFYLLRTSCNYWFGYRSIIFTANQKSYIVTGVTNISYGILYLIEIFITVFTRNFLLYSMCITIVNFARLLIINGMGKSEMKILKGYKKATIEKPTKRAIIQNTKGLIVSRMGQVLVNTTDSVLISAMVGTAFLGKYSNYQMITNGLRTLANTFPSAITASIGNAGVTETKRSMSRNFMVIDLSYFFIYTTLTVLIFNVSNPVISTFFGTNRTLSIFSVALICLNFYFTNLRDILITYKSSLGLYWYDRKRPIIEGLTNLVTSIILGKFLGFDGIIIGTLISTVFVDLVIEPRIVFHNGLHSSSIWYYITISGRLVLTIGLAAITYLINSFIHLTGIFEILAKSTITLIVVILVFFLFYRKSEDAKMIVNTIKIAFMDKAKLQKMKKAKAPDDNTL